MRHIPSKCPICSGPVEPGTTTFSIGLLVSLIFKRQRLLAGVIFASVILALNILIDPASAMELYFPGNSLRPIRSFIPYFSASLIYFLVLSRLQPVVLYAGIGGIAGMTFLWSNDYGLSTAMLIIILGIFLAYRSNELNTKNLLSIFGSALIVGVGGLMIATNGHAVELLQYNFIDVATDQYWYFCCWDPNIKIFTVSEVFSKFMFAKHNIGLWFVVWIAMLVSTHRSYSVEKLLILFIGLALFFGGAIASIGGHIERGYMAAFFFWCQSITFVYSVCWIFKRLSDLRTFKLPHSLFAKIWKGMGKQGSNLWGWVVLLATGSVLIVSVAQYQNYKATARDDPARFYVKELGGYLPLAWFKHVELARSNKDKYVIEEYWGLRGGVARNRNLLPVDSTIHALGNVRERFQAQMETLPDHVITSSLEKSQPWYGWLISANWWLYKILLENYDYQQTSPSTYFWSKLGRTYEWPSVGCRIESNANGKAVVIEASHTGYFEVTLIKDSTDKLNLPSMSA